MSLSAGATHALPPEHPSASLAAVCGAAHAFDAPSCHLLRSSSWHVYTTARCGILRCPKLTAALIARRLQPKGAAPTLTMPQRHDHTSHRSHRGRRRRRRRCNSTATCRRRGCAAAATLPYLDVEHARDGQAAHGTGARALEQQLGALVAHAEVAARQDRRVLAAAEADDAVGTKVVVSAGGRAARIVGLRDAVDLLQNASI